MLMKNFISFSFSDSKETEKSEENTIYLFDFEPNIRDFQKSIYYLLQSCIRIKFKIEFQRNRNEHVEQELLTLPEFTLGFKCICV
jgi:hypothetical protein